MGCTNFNAGSKVMKIPDRLIQFCCVKMCNALFVRLFICYYSDDTLVYFRVDWACAHKVFKSIGATPLANYRAPAVGRSGDCGNVLYGSLNAKTVIHPNYICQFFNCEISSSMRYRGILKWLYSPVPGSVLNLVLRTNSCLNSVLNSRWGAFVENVGTDGGRGAASFPWINTKFAKIQSQKYVIY